MASLLPTLAAWMNQLMEEFELKNQQYAAIQLFAIGLIRLRFPTSEVVLDQDLR